MGHRVSTPRHEACTTRVISLAILLAVASSASASASASRPSSCCSCFITQQPSRQHDPPLQATLNSILTSSTVPPPNSRLGRSQNRQSSTAVQQSSALQRREPPGTKRSQRIASGKQKAVGNHRRTDLRYAMHHSAHYYSEESSSNTIDDEDSLAITKVTAQYFDKRGNHTHDVQNKSASYRRGQRAKMIRFLDQRFARLHLKSSSINSNSSSSNDNNSNNSRKDYERRKAAWAAKYTSVSTLRKSFGTNRNRLWGDFNPTTTRRLYHTLLPRALLELRGLRDGLLSNTMKENGELLRNGTSNDDKNLLIDDSIDISVGGDNYLQQELKELAPLAYQARLAAKKYARERSRLPGRLGSMLYDGYRSRRRYGKWKSTGMTWEQVWNKYEDQVLREAMEELEDASAKEANKILSESSSSSSSAAVSNNDGIEGMDTSALHKAGGEELDDEELTARICLRILERSVVTNKSIDKLFLRRLAEEDDSDEDEETDEVVEESHKRRQQRQRRLLRREKKIQADLYAIEKKFDDDIRELLKYSNLATMEGEERRRKRKRGAFFWRNKSTNDNSSSALTDDEKSLLDNVSQAEEGEEYVSNVDDIEGKTRVAFNRSGDASSDGGTAVESVEKLAADMMSAKLKVEGVEGTRVDGIASSSPVGTSVADNPRDDTQLRKLAIHEVFALRLLATTKQRLSLLQDLPQLGTADAESSNNTEDTSDKKE